jgi:hypothetical protein
LLLAPIVALSGCLWPEQSEQGAFIKRARSTISPDYALLEVALVERPLGDDYIDRIIWNQTDEMLGDLDRRDALDQNGLRVGQLVGTIPSEFQDMLLSKRFCSNPEALIFPAGQTVPIFLGAVLPHSSYEFVKDQARTEVYLDQARYCLDVTARFTPEGKTTLTFAPKVENGAPTIPFEAVPEKSGWQRRVERACKKYPELTWEVTLGLNQVCLVGTRSQRPRTLGYAAFTDIDDEQQIQRLLVIRNSRSVSTQEAQRNTADDLVRASNSAPLALQATAPATRAKTP